jgi:FecR-like protein
MTINRLHRGGFTPQPTAFSALRKVIVIMAWWMAVSTIPAHSQIHQARITNVNSTVMLRRSVGGNPGPVILKTGDILQLGDIIDTGKGTVVIEMSDGSQVTIFPNSSVRLKDFSSAGSWRDLLEVVVGRIRARINHGKRPNPYRVYSPIASIAVRGTDFLVIVEANGETRVFVFEGLVEVSSLINPQQSVLVKPGRNIVVRPDGDISMVMSAPRGELNEIRSLRGWSGPGSSLRNAYYSQQRNFPELRSSRYTAFRDSHLDSLLNPAYATEFRQPAGRFYLIPTLSPRIESNFYGGSRNNSINLSSVISSNFTLSPQGTFFTPIGSRIVVGGGAAVTRTDLGGTESEIISEITNGAYKATHNDGSLGFTTANLSLMAARRFGKAERTSFGIKFDYLEDRSSYSFNTNTTEPMNLVPAHQEGNYWYYTKIRR